TILVLVAKVNMEVGTDGKLFTSRADLVTHGPPARVVTPCYLLYSMSIERINSSENSQFTRILSHATKVPGLIFLSGQTPVDNNGKLVEGGIQEHTTQCIKNLGNVLEAA
ncbi:hypothetical protein MPER_14445, partial [Moniliophthora perniciosa FA553]